jgi:hypothetical protein
MSEAGIVRTIGLLLCGFLLGVVVVVAVRYMRSGLGYDKDLVPLGTFADVRVSTGITKSRREALIVRKADYPFIQLSKDNKSGEIGEFDILDGLDRRLLVGAFEGGRLSTITVFNNSGSVVFGFGASNKAGMWERAHYVNYDDASKKLIGTHYTDVDFDGRFDAKAEYNQDGRPIGAYIYKNEQWQKVDWFNVYQRAPTPVEARVKEADKEVRFDFEYGKGWAERKPGAEEK